MSPPAPYRRGDPPVKRRVLGLAALGGMLRNCYKSERVGYFRESAPRYESDRWIGANCPDTP
jgi:hypothetical protein